MQVTEFRLLSLSMQAHLLCRHGVYLSWRTEGNAFVALYALFNYYTEVYYQPQTSEVVMITSFHSTSLLEPYLAKVDLHWLTQPALNH